MDHRLVILFKGNSQYDSVNTMVDQLAAALRSEGVGALTLDTRAANCVATAVTLIQEDRVRLFISPNGFGIPEAGQDAGFYRACSAPVLIYFVDHPAYHYPRIGGGRALARSGHSPLSQRLVAT